MDIPSSSGLHLRPRPPSTLSFSNRLLRRPVTPSFSASAAPSAFSSSRPAPSAFSSSRPAPSCSGFSFLPRPASIPLPDDMYDQEWCQTRRLPSCNRLAILQERQLGRTGRRGSKCYFSNDDIMQTIPLSRCIQVSENEQSYDAMITWTPSGDRLIAFGANHRTIRIYSYQGVQQAMSRVPTHQLLPTLLRLEHEIQMPRSDYLLRYESINFTADARHFVVAMYQQLPDSQVSLTSAIRSNESLSLGHHALENYIFFSIDIEKGQVCGEQSFLADRISLCHGVSLSDRHLLITSTHHQTLHVLMVHSLSGSLLNLRSIGATVHDDEDLFIHTDPHSAFLKTHFLSGFKQRLCTFLFKRAKAEGRVAEFLRSAAYRGCLRIDRAHLFDEYFILLRMLPKDCGRDGSSLPCFFVVLDWRSATVLDVFDAFDERFLSFFDSSTESLMFPMTSSDSWPGAKRFSETGRMNVARITRRGARNSNDVMRRLLSLLPYPSAQQQFKISLQSPYLDPKYFHIEEKFHAAVQAGKVRIDSNDTKVISRRSQRCLFRLRLASLEHSRQVSLLFHPTDPLCFAVDRGRVEASLLVLLPPSADFSRSSRSHSSSSSNESDGEIEADEDELLDQQ